MVVSFFPPLLCLDSSFTLWFSASPSPAPRPIVEEDRDEDPTSVMLRSAQDPEMKKFYDGLPKIDSFADVTPFGVDAQESLTSLRVSVVSTGKNMPASDFKWVHRLWTFSPFCLFVFSSHRNLISGLLFTRYAFYANLSRIDPALLEVDPQTRIKLRDSTTFCHCLMSGVVTASAIVSSVEVTGQNGKYLQHRITIAPFPQEMRRDTSVWGQLLDFSVIKATTSQKGFSFVTRGSNQTSKYSSSCASCMLSFPLTF